MKVVRIEDANKISFNNLRAEFNKQFLKHFECDVTQPRDLSI